MTNIYQGENSCWAKHERVYVPGSGVDAKAARGILSLIEKELKRGWTYDKPSCRRIRMTPALAKRRAVYLIALAKRHYGDAEARRVAEIVYRWLERHRLLSGAVRRRIAAYVTA
jgi:phage gp16-like protein